MLQLERVPLVLGQCGVREQPVQLGVREAQLAIARRAELAGLQLAAKEAAKQAMLQHNLAVKHSKPASEQQATLTAKTKAVERRRDAYTAPATRRTAAPPPNDE